MWFWRIAQIGFYQFFCKCTSPKNLWQNFNIKPFENISPLNIKQISAVCTTQDNSATFLFAYAADFDPTTYGLVSRTIGSYVTANLPTGQTLANVLTDLTTEMDIKYTNVAKLVFHLKKNYLLLVFYSKNCFSALVLRNNFWKALYFKWFYHKLCYRSTRCNFGSKWSSGFYCTSDYSGKDK